MAKKTTKKDYYNTLLTIEAVASNQELVSFINHELELLEKKNASRKEELTETQIENMELTEKIVKFMGNRTVTIAEIRKQFGLSSQKVSPIMSKLVKANRVTKTVEKKISYFTVNEAE